MIALKEETLADFCGGLIEDKSALADFKAMLTASCYAPASVNGMIAAVNIGEYDVGFNWML